jgi:hypothetical protein
MITEKDIYKLRLHESLDIPPELSVTRVPGGWIYRFWDNEKEDYYPNVVFVPYIQIYK